MTSAFMPVSSAALNDAAASGAVHVGTSARMASSASEALKDRLNRPAASSLGVWFVVVAVCRESSSTLPLSATFSSSNRFIDAMAFLYNP